MANLYTTNSEEALYFNQEDAVVWLDPLDGTKGFLDNDRG